MTIYNMNIFNESFKCCDEENRNSGQPEIEFCFEGKSIVIEAKTLEPEVVSEQLSHVKSLQRIINKLIIKQSLDIYRWKNYDITLNFNEGVFLLQNSIYKPNKYSEQYIKFTQYLVDVINKMIDSQYSQRYLLIDLKDYFEQTYKYKNYGSYKELKLKKVFKEDFFDAITNDNKEKFSWQNEYYENVDRYNRGLFDNSQELLVEISIYEGAGSVNYGVLYDTDHYNNEKEISKYYSKLVNSAITKFENYPNSKKVLFLNSNLSYLQLCQCGAIDRILKLSKYSSINEIWCECYETIEITHDNFNYLEEVVGEKGYIQLKN